MAISYVAEVHVPSVDNAANQGTTVTFTPPSMTTGDFVLVYVATFLGSQSWSVTTTGGQTWTEEFDETRTGTHALYWCIWDGTWDANPVFTRTGAAANDIMGWMVVLRGVDPSTPWDVDPTGRTAADTNDQDFADFNTNTDGAWAVWGGFEIDNNTCETNNGTEWDGAGTTVGWRVSTLLCQAMCRKPIATAGAAGATTLNYSANDAGGKWSGALKNYVAPAVDLVVADLSHAHTSEAFALTQVHELVVNAASHDHTLEAFALTQVHLLAVADSSHAHALEEPLLEPQVPSVDLIVADLSHAHTSEAFALTQVHNLTVGDSTHAHTLDAPVLTVPAELEIADSTHAHTLEAPSLTQVHNITVQDSAHLHALEAFGLTQVHILTLADSTHAHALDNLELTVGGATLEIADLSHSHTLEAPNLTQLHNLQVQDSSHAHGTDPIVLTQVHILIVADVSHAHTLDNLVFLEGVVLVVADVNHAHTLEEPVLVGVILRPEWPVAPGSEWQVGPTPEWAVGPGTEW